MLDSAIYTGEVDELLQTARESGGIGGKLLGAGGGGFLFLYCEPGKQVHVERAVERLGGKAFPVRFDLDGLQTWRSPRQGSGYIAEEFVDSRSIRREEQGRVSSTRGDSC